ncbi:Citrate synthase (si) [hydrothermal vent metagenome]|uniref:citrate synthase (unknown stereospecificity) n=1 Tax=hydrothermal vent metagenome TaxID=652676 RepID=A0A3B1D4A7_9ZZZZ
MSDYSPGLAGVLAARSKVSYLDGSKGLLEYRGIPIETLAEKSTFIETAYLLLFGNLPTPKQLKKFDDDIRAHRRIKYRIIDLIKCLPESGHPMDALQAAVAALGMFYPAKNVQDPEIQYISAVRLIAKLPTIIAAYARLRRGDDHVQPRDDLTFSENFLYMLTEKVPNKIMSEIFDTCLILHAEHTMNASTFSGLVTASTLSDPYTVVSSAVGTLMGPLHGGANEKVLSMLSKLGSIDKVRPYIESKVKANEKIMGLGHRVYKVKDPRAIILQKLAKRLFKHLGTSPLYEIAVELEKVGEEFLAGKKVYANVDFYSGILYQKMGIETDFFTPIFAMSRVTGWLAHAFEQVKDNHIFRPREIYDGEHGRPYISISER